MADKLLDEVDAGGAGATFTLGTEITASMKDAYVVVYRADSWVGVTLQVQCAITVNGSLIWAAIDNMDSLTADGQDRIELPVGVAIRGNVTAGTPTNLTVEIFALRG